MHHDNPITDAILDSTALSIALVVSMTMLLVTFTSIAPDLATKIGMGSLSFVVAFFSVRGWLSKTTIGLIICVLFSCVEVFSHTSFALISTSLQAKAANSAQVKLEDDTEYKRLVARANELQTTANNLAGAVANLKEGYRSEVDIRQKGTENQTQTAKEASDAVTKYVESFRARAVQPVSEAHIMIDADRFFTAIPDALTSGAAARWIAFVFSLAIFMGVQLTVLVAADGVLKLIERKASVVNEEEIVQEETGEELLEVKRNGRTPGIRREIPKKTILAWVNVYWADHTSGVADKLVARPLARKALDDSGVKVTDNWDQ